MSNYPNYIPPPVISTISAESLGLSARMSVTNVAIGSGAWPSSNRAYFIPFNISITILVTKLWVANGTTASNNFDVGIYDEQGTRIISSGSTARTGTSVVQSVNITDTMIGPGRFYFGLAQDGTSGHNIRFSGITSAGQAGLVGVYSMNSAFALPATATFATSATSYIPICGLLVSPNTVI